jgi:hypothetical protein
MNWIYWWSLDSAANAVYIFVIACLSKFVTGLEWLGRTVTRTGGGGVVYGLGISEGTALLASRDRPPPPARSPGFWIAPGETYLMGGNLPFLTPGTIQRSISNNSPTNCLGPHRTSSTLESHKIRTHICLTYLAVLIPVQQ